MLRSRFLLLSRIKLPSKATALSRYSGNTVPVHGFATTSVVHDVDYEINYITLTKVPKAPEASDSKNPGSTPQRADRVAVEQSLNEVNKLLDEDFKQFVLRYSTELTRFLSFIRSSYDNKIKSFNQLTTVEIGNSLYIFKDYYLKNKIPGIDKYNYISYNYMFDNLLKLSRKHRDLPELLSSTLLINTQGIQLLNAGFSNYLPEAIELDFELDLGDPSMKFETLISTIDGLVEENKRILAAEDAEEYGETFYESYILLNKYKNLRSILTQVQNISASNLHALLQDEKFVKAVELLRKKNIEMNASRMPNLDFLKFAIKDVDSNYIKINRDLNRLKTSAGKHQKEIETMYADLLYLCCDGIIDAFDKPLHYALTQFKISNDLFLNFEFSMMFKHKLFLFVDQLRVLKIHGVDLSSKGAVKAIKNLKFKNATLKTSFAELEDHLTDFFDSIVSTKTNCLYDLVAHKNWMDWCLENHNSRIPRSLIDYSNLADYPYKSIEISTELAEVLPNLAKFSTENNVNLSAFSLDYLLTLFKDSFAEVEELRKLYLDHGNVYLSNLQNIIDDYNILRYNLSKLDLVKIRSDEGIPFREFNSFQLKKYFGYYLSIIKNPLVLDNLEILYKHYKASSHSKDDILEELSNFKYELEILKVDEFQNNFASLTKEEILACLNRRINEVLSNLNSNPQSRLNSHNLNKFSKLNELLTIYFGKSNDTKILDSFISYKQIPDRFRMHEFAPDLYTIYTKLGKLYKECSMSEVFDAVNSHIESYPDENSMDHKHLVRLSTKLQQLFRLNGGFTSILDTIISNQVQFEKMEAKLFGSKKVEQDWDQPPNVFVLGEKKATPNSEKPSVKSDAYVQIPENIKIHEFSRELEVFKEIELKDRDFGNFSSKEIEDILESRLQQFFNGKCPSGFYINHKSIDMYMKLSSNLKRLFEVNGGHTGVLDAMINSELVFNKFEKLKRLIKEYRQLPDDFRLQEFVPEIQQLQNELLVISGSDEEFKFKNTEPNEVLKTLDDMSCNERKYNLSKRGNFAKLLKNLRVLFHYNGDDTSVLDNILINSEVLSQVVSKPKVTKSGTELAIKNYKDNLQYFFQKTGLAGFDLVGFYDLTNEEFSVILDKFMVHVKKDLKYQYPVYSDLVTTLKEIYAGNPHELAVLCELTRQNKFDNIDEVRINVEKFMDDLSRNKDLFAAEEPDATFTDYKSSIEVPVQKFDIKDFKDKEATKEKPSRNYSKGTDKLNIKESSMEDSELFVRNQIFHQLDNKDGKQESFEDMVKISPEEIRASYKSKKRLNEMNLQNFLENVNKEKKSRDEEEFRQSKAFEWSNSKIKSNRSLESKNFFNSLARREKEGLKYLILTMQGEKIITKENPFGNEQVEDMFTIFDRFNEEEMNKFAKNINKLQLKSWRLVGGGSGNYGKMLVFSRADSEKPTTSIFSKVKTILAVTGATFMMLVGLNYFLDDIPSVQDKPKEGNASLIEATDIPVPKPLDEKKVALEGAVENSTPSGQGAQDNGWFWK